MATVQEKQAELFHFLRKMCPPGLPPVAQEMLGIAMEGMVECAYSKYPCNGWRQLALARPAAHCLHVKGASKVFDKLMDDFGTPPLFTTAAQRAVGPRVVGLSLPPRRGAAQLRGVSAYGLRELDQVLHVRVRTAFEERQAAYVREVGAAACLCMHL